VAGDFLNRPGGRPDFASPTYVVQIIDSGTRKTHLYKEGFKILEFSDVQSKFPMQAFHGADL